ncbi:hypothetical protein [Dactylosporangium siamense]|nr:hypothetical protein [Dactylosporangium siamense]
MQAQAQQLAVQAREPGQQAEQTAAQEQPGAQEQPQAQSQAP